MGFMRGQRIIGTHPIISYQLSHNNRHQSNLKSNSPTRNNQSKTMSELKTAIVSPEGKTRLRAALERAQSGGAPCVGQWMEFPGYTLARTIAGLGMFDVCSP
jgi:hypothetical protein